MKKKSIFNKDSIEKKIKVDSLTRKKRIGINDTIVCRQERKVAESKCETLML